MNRETAPDSFRVKFMTTAGDFTIEAHRDWSPHGVDRFYNLVEAGYYDGNKFFRVLDRFVAQFGIHGDPAVSAAWRAKTIPDDPVTQSNERGTVTFAMAGPGTRTTQLFVNLVDNKRLDSMGFAPIAKVVEGMETVDSLYSGYGEGAPRGKGPDQTRIHTEGNDYLDKEYEKLDAIETARVVDDG